MKYTLTVTEKQKHVILTALEIYARLGMGQSSMALDALPVDWHNKGRSESWVETKLAVFNTLSRHMIEHVDGWRSYLGITNPKTSDSARIAWDIYQVLRNENKIQNSGVWKVSGQPLPKIASANNTLQDGKDFENYD